MDRRLEGRGLALWLPSYVLGSPARWWRRRRHGGPRHVIFLVCDHFEPRHGIRGEGEDAERVATWAREYPGFRERCRRAFGHAPEHTWFYPPHHGLEHLSTLGRMEFDGCGEVELHYHHSRDDSRSLREGLRRAIESYQRRGLLLESGVPPRTAFAFVHGDWALDNSAGGRHCGVNDELTILQELGCWGDFTMPSANECQTRKINAIYYAIDDPLRPKSHDRGVDARVGRTSPPGLFMLQGPLAVNWRAPGHPRIENGSLTSENWGRPDRVRRWLDCHVHVRGRPEWVFIKLHTHGALERDHDALFGERAFALHSTLNQWFNDGVRYRLHYATAREAYNIAKAAEAGHGGDPSPFRDFAIAPYAASFYWLSAEHRLLACSRTELRFDRVSAPGGARLRLRQGPVLEVEGAFEGVDLSRKPPRLRVRSPRAAGRLALVLAREATVQALRGAAPIAKAEDAGGVRLVLEVGAEAEIALGEQG